MNLEGFEVTSALIGIMGSILVLTIAITFHTEYMKFRDRTKK
jgi:hypothetical protein